jgi:hypothetical protein
MELNKAINTLFTTDDEKELWNAYKTISSANTVWEFVEQRERCIETVDFTLVENTQKLLN